MIPIVAVLFLLLGLLVISPWLSVFVVVGLAPAFVAYIVDTKPGRNTFQTVMFFNLAGVSIKFMEFLNTNFYITSRDALNIKFLLLIYIFAAIGYFVVWLVPKIVVIIVDYKNERNSLRIKQRMTELIEEWGPEVKGSR